MTTPAEATEYTVEISERHVAEQQDRIERQRELLAKLELDHSDMVAEARRFLTEMEKTLVAWKQHAAAAQERVAQHTVVEQTLAKAEKDRPM